MPIERHDCWRCTHCDHLWLRANEKPPEKCAKCKRRGWNKLTADEKEKRTAELLARIASMEP